MKTIHCKSPDESALKTAAAIIQNGGLVAFPTETVYGLGANALDPTAAKKIYLAKGRPSDNPLIIHLASAKDAEKYCVTGAMYDRLTEAFSPGPLTIVLPKRDCIPYEVTGGLDTVAVRIPSHPIARKLIEYAGVPIAAPSANRSGKPSPTEFSHVEQDLDGIVDMLIDGGPCKIGLESTIVRIDADDRLSLLRPGGITVEMLAPFAPGGICVDTCVTAKPQEGERPLAPGMAYRHYAPDAPLILLSGSDGAFRAFLEEEALHGEAFGVLCYEEDGVIPGAMRTVSLGKRDDPMDQAHRLFSCLRQFNEDPPHVIYARMPDQTGIGLAVFNRLIKAAGYSVKQLEGDFHGKEKIKR